MPGLLTKLMVQIGQEVKADKELAVIEALKMENVLRAEQDTKVLRLQRWLATVWRSIRR